MCWAAPAPMYHISPHEFTEFVRLSHSWSDLARRCGQPLKFGRFCSSRCVSALKQKVLSLRLDTQHFTSRNTRPEIADDAFRDFVRDSTKLSDLMRKCRYCYSSRHARAYCMQRIQDLRLSVTHFRLRKSPASIKPRTSTKLHAVDDERFRALVTSSNSWFDLMQKCGYKHSFRDQKTKCMRRDAQLALQQLDAQAVVLLETFSVGHAEASALLDDMPQCRFGCSGALRRAERLPRASPRCCLARSRYLSCSLRAPTVSAAFSGPTTLAPVRIWISMSVASRVRRSPSFSAAARVLIRSVPGSTFRNSINPWT